MRRVLVSVAVVLMAAVSVCQAVITGPPIEAFTRVDDSNDIVIGPGNTSFSADLSSYAGFIVNVHTVAGYHAASGGAGWADIQHEDQAGLWSSAAYTMLGRGASGDSAWIVYKFRVVEGSVTDAGGTIDAHFDFTGSPATQGNNMWIGVHDSMTLGLVGGELFSVSNAGDFDKVTMLDTFGDNGYGTYHGQVSLTIPQDLMEFYVVVADAGNTGYMAYTSLEVSCPVKDGAGPHVPTITGPPIEGFTRVDDSNDIVIGPESTSFSADLSDYDDFVTNVHTIAGYYNGSAGWADIQHENQAGLWSSGPYTMLGRGASANTAWIVYKFRMAEGYITDAGGTIDAHFDFTGSPATQGNKMWIGVNDSMTLGLVGGELFSVSNADDFDKVTMLDAFGDNGYGQYHGDVNLTIPTDVDAFYVVLADAGNTGYMAYTSLEVNCPVVEGEAPPTPGITGPPIAGFTTADDSKDILLSTAQSTFTADLSWYHLFIGDVHTVAGFNGLEGQADMQYENGEAPFFFGNISSSYAMVGRSANGNTAYFVYKFVTEPGQKTSGGTIAADVFFNGAPDTQGSGSWVGVNTTLQVWGDHATIHNRGDFTKVTMADQFSGAHGNYYGTVNLTVPAGVTEFYVMVADDGGSGRLATTAVQVSASLTTDPDTCPMTVASDYNGDCAVDSEDLAAFTSVWLDCVDPCNGICDSSWTDVPLTIWGPWGPDLPILTYELNNAAINETGASGSVMIHPAVGDSQASIELYKQEMIDAIQAGQRFAMDNFMIRMRFGVATANWSGQTWLDGADWTNAMASLEAAAQLASDVGVKTIIFDVEMYSTISPYLFTRTETAQLQTAYDKGLAVGNAIKAIDDSLNIMIIPELEADAFWATDATGYQALKRFRNGLLKAQLGGGVYVGLEGTYGYGDQANDDEITLRLNGVLTGFSDAASYYAAAVDYIQTVAGNLRSQTDADNLAYWDQSCGIAPALWCLGSFEPAPALKVDAWYPAVLLETQLQAFTDAGAKLIWQYGPTYPFKQYNAEQAVQMGYDPGDALYEYLQGSTNPDVQAYLGVLRAFGNDAAADLNKDGYINLLDFGLFAADWQQVN